jgi:hypothetical protein
MEVLVKQIRTNPYAAAELAAIEWAIPILEDYVISRYGILPTGRSLQGKKGTLMLNKIYRESNHTCYLCGKQVPRVQASVDHVIPLSKGGKDDGTNYKLAHSRCNTEKGNMLLADYLRFKERELTRDEK